MVLAGDTQLLVSLHHQYFEIGKGYALKVNDENGYLKWQIN